MPCYSFDHTILPLAVHLNSATLSEIFGDNQCKGAGLREQSLGSTSSFSTVLLDMGNLAIKGGNNGSSELAWGPVWESVWRFGCKYYEKCAVPVKSKHSFTAQLQTEISNWETLCLSSAYTHFDQDKSFLCVLAQRQKDQFKTSFLRNRRWNEGCWLSPQHLYCAFPL